MVCFVTVLVDVSFIVLLFISLRKIKNFQSLIFTFKEKSGIKKCQPALDYEKRCFSLLCFIHFRISYHYILFLQFVMMLLPALLRSLLYFVVFMCNQRFLLLINLRINKDKFGQSKGFAYLEFVEVHVVQNDLILNETELHGRQLKASAKCTNMSGLKQYFGRRPTGLRARRPFMPSPFYPPHAYWFMKESYIHMI
ncbi:unnamed protein product [Trifolium pratense]|uniref:Uncharacterized protein n=1 Tax=Trifolium pratense TaxID=57577 RepID=A0ACB0K5X6_TRIPR|nr:unnamed protein product [Trifolium pratense]